ncbi:MAG: isoprenylcysteine carboxylmethyltransferase family protein [Candidatus Bathyarchaeota archaeon]|nr:isoprenylcysteine carboxylmethyltransferase family protein [Candidatus Bathyarchaeota archaeon]
MLEPYAWFLICVACMFIAVVLHFKSVEHRKFQKKYGVERGIMLGKIFGTVSGTMEFAFLIGLWVSPQPKFVVPIFPSSAISVVGLSISLINLVVSLSLLVPGAWIAIWAVSATGLEVAETHCTPTNLTTSGPYSIVRHPQYLGWILAHIGVSILFSVAYSMLFTPVLVALVYLISRKEEQELLKELGREYEDYKKRVPMLIPRFRRR